MTYTSLLNYALRILQIKNYSQADLLAKLRKKSGGNCNEDIIQAVITRLIELQFINDYEYACSLIRRKTRSSPCGLHHIKYYLKRYSIPSTIIDDALTDAQIDEFSLAQEVLFKKYIQLKKISPDKQRQKIYQMLAQRGFRSDTIAKILQKHNNIDTLGVRI